MEKKYYVYEHTRLDKNEVFYVGMSTCNATKGKHPYPRAFYKSSRPAYWRNIVGKTEYRVDIVFESTDHQLVKDKEIELIALYGREDLGLGPLVNLTNGGDGASGKTSYISPETRKKITKALTGKKRDPKVTEKIWDTRRKNGTPGTWKNKKQPKDLVDKRVATIKKKGGAHWSGDARKKASEHRLGIKLPESQYSWRYKKVEKYTIEGLFIEDFNCIRDAALSCGGIGSEISCVCKSYADLYKKGDKNYGRKQHKGFIWKYKN